MLYRSIVVVGISILLSSCGGSGSNDSSIETPVDTYDLSKYMNSSLAKPEFYRMDYFNNDGQKAWFNINGEPVAEPITDAEKKLAFSKLKVINEFVGDTALSRTKYLNSDFGNDGVDGPFLFADHTPIYIRVEAKKVIKYRESQGNEAYSDMTVLDKYNMEIPRYYKNLDTLVINSSNSSMLDTYDVCVFEFKDVVNLAEVTTLASGIHKDVLKLSCSIFSSQDDSSLGFRNYYLERSVGEIHRTTSLGQGIVQHIITDRRILN